MFETCRHCHSTDTIQFLDLGFDIVATKGTARHIDEAGIKVEVIKKVAEGRPHVVDAMKNGQVNLIVNTTEGKQSILDSASIRRRQALGIVKGAGIRSM